jgi:shikimate kinase
MRFYLVGFMGSGKSYLGKLWAAQQHLSFYDLDTLIEEKENDSIINIFEQKGEQYFRTVESKTLHETIALQNVIIACGGGTPCFNDNMNWMNAHGTTIFLHASIENLYKNILQEKLKRPLLANITDEALEHFIQNKLDERLHYYASSKIIIPQEDLNETGFKKVLQNINNA